MNFGFDLTQSNADFNLDISLVDKKKYSHFSESELIKIGSDTFRQVIAELFYKRKNKPVVPISGGLDSRAILATLIELCPVANIHTYTYGTPGALDFEIGNEIAKILGTNHTAFNLTEHEYTLEEEKLISRRSNHQSLLLHHPPVLELDKLYAKMDIWSGFFGDPASGSNLLNFPISNQEFKNFFLEKHLFAKKTLTSIDFEKFYGFIDPPVECLETGISYYECIDFYNIQQKYIYPLIHIEGSNYITPFTHVKWLGFILSLENKYRINQYLYKKILLSMFPKIFTVRTTSNLGLSLNASSLRVNLSRVVIKLGNIYGMNFVKNTNYIDFNEGFRNRKDLNNIIDYIRDDSIFMDKFPNVYDMLFDKNKISNANEILLIISFYFNEFLS